MGPGRKAEGMWLGRGQASCRTSGAMVRSLNGILMVALSCLNGLRQRQRVTPESVGGREKRVETFPEQPKWGTNKPNKPKPKWGTWGAAMASTGTLGSPPSPSTQLSPGAGSSCWRPEEEAHSVGRVETPRGIRISVWEQKLIHGIVGSLPSPL